MARFVQNRNDRRTWTPVRDPSAPDDAPDGEVDIIWVAPAMDYATRAAVSNDSFEFRQGKKPQPKSGQKGRAVPPPDDDGVEMRIKSPDLALLVHNVMHWEGPSFRQYPCTPGNIRLLAPDDPHTQVVLDTINEINGSTRQQESDDPKSALQNGTSISQAVASSPSQDIMYTGASPVLTSGHNET
jgi:hypothetical protein